MTSTNNQTDEVIGMKNTADILAVMDERGISINENIQKFIDETAQAESGISDNPTTVKSPITGAAGIFQFIETEKNNSFTTGLNRLSAKKKDGSYVYFNELPEWIEEAKKHKDVTKLNKDQQTALFLANLHQQIGTDDLFKKISEGDMQAKVDMYMDYHFKKDNDNVRLYVEKIFWG